LSEARRKQQREKRRRQQVGWILVLIVIAAGVGFYLLQPSQMKAEAEQQIAVATEQSQQAFEVAQHRNDEAAIAQTQEAIELVSSAQTLLISEDYAGARALATEANRIAKSVLDLQSAKILEAYDAKILIEDIMGELRVNEEVAVEKLFRGQPLKVGDVLKTGEKSAVKIYFANGIRLVLNSNSELHLQEDLKQVHPAILFLPKGKLSFETKDGPEAAFTHVITDQGSAFIRTNGIGWLETKPGEKGESHLLLRAGRGKVENRWGEKVFLSNQHVNFTREGEPVVDDWVLASPRAEKPADGSRVKTEGGEIAKVTFDWTDVREAKGYAIQVARDPYFIQLIKQQGLLEQSAIQYSDLQTGNYYWRVAAIDGENRVGPYSRPYNFRVLPVQSEDVPVRDIEPPSLAITDAYVQGYYLLIWGKTDRDAIVFVNQENAVVDHDTGEFFYTTSLPVAGDYTINVRAEDALGNASEKQLPVQVKD
jgi:hypothetical protein